MQEELARLSKRIERERAARHEAEMLAERGTRQLYDRQRELELLIRITDAANGAASTHEALQVALDEMCAYTEWPVGHAYFVGENPGVLLPSKIWHLDQPLRFETFREVTEQTRFKPGEGLPGTVLETRKPFWIPDVAKAENFPRAKQSKDIGVVAAFAFPVLAGDAVMAVLEFFSGERVEPEETWLRISEQAGIQLGRIFERQQAQAELEKMHRELLGVSRRAGMAEVATGMLHNVGNVLNSVSVSATLMQDRLRRSKAGNLRAAAEMLQRKDGRLVEFLTSDPKGKLVPEYIGKAAEQLEREQAELISEANVLIENIEHIKGIVATQQDYAKVAGLDEKLDASVLVEDALRMTAASLVRHRIRLVRALNEATPQVKVDRHKVLQILINLIRNAVHAMDRAHERVLTISVGPRGRDRVQVCVQDNGIGIPPENMKQIFNHGFTTKKDGHGFGLHSGANAAKEMGGSLRAESEGENLGANFILELPVFKAQPEAKA
jgi:signal transduction histidine kinase